MWCVQPICYYFYNFYSFSNSYGIYCSPFSIFRIAGHFLVSTRVKKLTKYVGNFENSQIFAGEQNNLCLLYTSDAADEEESVKT